MFYSSRLYTFCNHLQPCGAPGISDTFDGRGFPMDPLGDARTRGLPTIAVGAKGAGTPAGRGGSKGWLMWITADLQVVW